MKHTGKKEKNILLGAKRAVMTAVLLVFIMACGAITVSAETDVEWGRFQNSGENNGVVDLPGPANYNETSMKWAKQMVQGYTTSFTPPLIIDGYLYTASKNNVYKIDKETGEVVQTSDSLKIDVSYAMNPMGYDEDHDLLFVQLLGGRVECVERSTLKHEWTSKEYKGFQALSPITYHNGIVYTGNWEDEKSDGYFYALDAETGETLWEFKPSYDGDTPKGFYWAGCYATDNFVVVGSDDGTDNTFSEDPNSFTESAALYSFSTDPKAEKRVIDKITGLKGDIRSTVVHHNGYVYLVSKGGMLYKVKLNSDGTFDKSTLSKYQVRYENKGTTTNPNYVFDESTAETNSKAEYGMMTASPVVHNGRIYFGVCGKGGQFSADGGHSFIVLNDDAKLSQSSYQYRVQIPGYPQAAPLLTTNTGQSGKVRLYFTYNAPPGGIYCVEDAPGQTTGKADLLFKPEIEGRQYSLSPICMDRDGAIYIKNDSGYLMAIAPNEAYLSGLSVKASGSDVNWNEPFESGTLNYYMNASNDAKTVDVKPEIPDGLTETVTVAGTTFTGSTVSVPFTEDEIDIPIQVTRTVGSKTAVRTYYLHVSRQSNNAYLGGIVINDSNTNPNNNNINKDYFGDDAQEGKSQGIGYDPEFSQDIVDYTGKTYGGSKEFLNVWFKAADPKAKVRVYPVENVGTAIDENGELKKIGNEPIYRVPVYFVVGEISATVRLEVTSHSGNAVKSYNVTIVRSNTATGKKPLIMTPGKLELDTVGKESCGNIKATFLSKDVTSECTWTSTDSGVATVDGTGMVSAGVPGTATIWAKHPNGGRKSVNVTVSNPRAENPIMSITDRTTLYEDVKVRAVAPSTGTTVKYTCVDDPEKITDPVSTGATFPAGGLDLTATEGETKTYYVSVAAYGTDYRGSEIKRYIYTIDKTQSPSPEGKRVDLTADRIVVPSVETLEYDCGTAPSDIISQLQSVKGQVAVIEGDTKSTVNADIVWNTEELDYQKDDVSERSFVVRGTAGLSDDITVGGANRETFVRIKIRKGSVAAPTISPAAGTYTTDQMFSLNTATNGAGIIYSTSESDQDETYMAPIDVSAAEGEKKTVTIKAYALKNRVISTTSKFVVTIDKIDYEELKRKEAEEKARKEAELKKKYTPAKAKITKVVKGKKKATVKWKRIEKNVKGYQIRFTPVKKSKKVKTVTVKVKQGKKKELSKEVKKLKSKNKYKVQVRAYNKVGKTVYYGKWSAAKTVKIK